MHWNAGYSLQEWRFIMHKNIFIRYYIVVLLLIIMVSVNNTTSFAVAAEVTSASEILSTSTSTTKVTKKLKKKAKKTYTRQISTSTDVTVNSTKNISYYIKKTEQVSTVTRKYVKYYKGKKYKHIFTEKVSTKEKITSQSGKTDLSPEIQGKIGSDLARAFQETGFTVDYWSGYKDSSYLSVSKKKIKCFNDESLLHQLGYFLSLINDNKCYTAMFIKVYEEEKTKYFGADKGTALESSGEFFACCYQLFLTEPSKFKEQMPKVYKIIEDCVNAVNDELIAKAKETL